jgi:hypothetical protein
MIDITPTPEEVTLLKGIFGGEVEYISVGQIQNKAESLENAVSLSQSERETLQRLRMFLQRVDAVASNLFQVLNPSEDLRILEISGHNSARAEVGFFRTPWSPNFVHGPDTMIFVTKLAEKILKPGESICALERVTWKKPIANNAILTISEIESSPFSVENGCLFDGTLSTNLGRKLHFTSKERQGSTVQKVVANSNPYAKQVFCSCPDCYKSYGDVHIFDLKPPTADTQPYLLSTLCEIVTLALSKICHPDMSKERLDSMRLLGGIKNLELPSSAEAVFPPGGKLHVLIKPVEKKTGKSGMTLMPFEFRFPHQDQNSGSGIMAISYKQDMTEEYLRKCLKP